MSQASENFKNLHTGRVVIASCIALTWSIAVFMIRLHLRIGTKRPFGRDDYACAVGMIFGIGSTAAILVAVHNGLGKHQNTLSPHQVESLLKSTYAATLLYILGVTASKCSMSLLVSRLTPAKNHRIASYCVTCFATFWGAISTLVVAFQCKSHPWDVLAQSRCLGLMAQWTAIEIISCIIEVTILGLATHLLWSLHMPLKSKVMILGIFSLRLLVIIPIGFRIYYLPGELTDSDTTFNGVNSAIATQAIVHFSIMAATFPCMKPFLVAFDKGLGENSNMNSGKGVSFLGSSRHGRERGYILHSVGDDSSKSVDTRLRPDRGETETNIEHTPRRSPDAAIRLDEIETSDLMIIRKTQEWQVTNEPQP